MAKKKKSRVAVADKLYYTIFQSYDIDSHTWALEMYCKKCRSSTKEPMDIERRYCGLCHGYLPEF